MGDSIFSERTWRFANGWILRFIEAWLAGELGVENRMRKTEVIRRRYDRIASLYDVLESRMEKSVSKWREELINEVCGTVLEVGVGTGKNLPYYADNVGVTAIDFSTRMLARAHRKIRSGQNIRLTVMDVQHLEFADNKFDTIVCSFVFCSVADPVAGLREIRRVCKPRGRLLMLEHVRSEKAILGPLMDIINPVPLTLYGANINRRTVDNLHLAGFNNIQVTDLWLDIVKRIIAFNE